MNAPASPRRTEAHSSRYDIAALMEALGMFLLKRNRQRYAVARVTFSGIRLS